MSLTQVKFDASTLRQDFICEILSTLAGWGGDAVLMHMVGFKGIFGAADAL